MTEAHYNRPVVVRFAPSPTGLLHVGGARTALFNALFHIRHGGRFIFRVEDTDRLREITGAAERMLSDLNWLGIAFNEGEGIGGSDGPYRQSARGQIYRDAASRLLAKKVVYLCFCSSERIEELHRESSKAGKPPRYDKRCKDLTDKEIEELLHKGSSPVVRLSVEDHQVIEINDLVKGLVKFDSEHLDDPILVRSDGSSAGLLAGAADDHSMGVTHIFRGDEWLPSTPYQLLIFQALGGLPPEWGHLSLLVDESHAKLSKRTAGLSIAELREEGILPEAICRYLTGLGRGTIPSDRGWSLNDLASDFDPTNYRSGEIVYSKAALLGENQKYLRLLPVEELLARFSLWCGNRKPFGGMPFPKRLAALALASESASTFYECLDGLKSLLTRPDPSMIENPETYSWLVVLNEFARRLSEIEWSETGIQDSIIGAGRALGLKGRDIYFPIRIAITGKTHGPRLAAVMNLLGQEECNARLENYFKYFSFPRSTT